MRFLESNNISDESVFKYSPCKDNVVYDIKHSIVSI